MALVHRTHICAGVFGLLLFAAVARAEDAPAPGENVPETPVAKEDYCSSFVDAAAELRLTRQNAALANVRKEVDEKLLELGSKTEILKNLIDERKAMQSRVGDQLLKIYTSVEPEAAAQQLSKLQPGTAAELLTRLTPKRSGEILSLMDARIAASLVALMTLQMNPERMPKS